jgi:hypothetical protein
MRKLVRDISAPLAGFLVTFLAPKVLPEIANQYGLLTACSSLNEWFSIRTTSEQDRKFPTGRR